MHFLIFLVQKSFLTKNYFLTADRNLTTRGPLYTCLAMVAFKKISAKVSWSGYYHVLIRCRVFVLLVCSKPCEGNWVEETEVRRWVES